MEEQAKEELKMLEAQYPNQHEYLKLELRAFIFQLQSKHQDSQPENNHCSKFIALLDTEESTSLESLEQRKSREVMKGKIDEGYELESMEGKIDEVPKTDVRKHYTSRKNKRKDRVDLVLERAQACLKKLDM